VTGDVRSILVVATTPDPQPRTRGRDDRLYAVLNAAQYSYDDKATAWRIISSGRSDVQVFAELQSLRLPAGLVSAIAEQLAAR
jgi:hypothetical protein